MEKKDLSKITPPELINYGEYIAGDMIQPSWDIPSKIVITCAITGAFISKEQNIKQPYTPEEIAKEAIECCKAGISGLHIHVRDENGHPTGDPQIFHRAIDPILEKFPDMIIDCPTHYGKTVEDALKWAKEGLIEISPVRPSPSYTAEELITTSPEATIAMTKLLQELGIKPQIAIFYVGMVDNAYRYLIRTGILEKPFYWIIMPGLPGGDISNPMAMFESLLIYVRRIKEIDPASVWIVGSTGRASCYLTTAAILLGGHIRVGMEDILYRYPHKDVMVTSNVEEVGMAIQLAGLLGREVASPDEYRKLIGLKPKSETKG